MIIGIDFDGTCTTHEYPDVGKDIGAVPVLKRLVSEGHKLMLWTMRDSKNDGERDTLLEAILWFEKNGITLWSANENKSQTATRWSTSNKQHAELYIDDAALGCPLKQDYKLMPVLQGIETKTYGANSKEVAVGRPYADWSVIELALESKGILTINSKINV